MQAVCLEKLSKEEKSALLGELNREYDTFRSAGLKLDMSRGKPCAQQLALSNELLAGLSEADFALPGGLDARNYGMLSGIPQMKQIFSELLDTPPENILVGGNSSLNLMYDFVSRSYTHGPRAGMAPWKDAPVKWLCPSPGYDRHFAVTEHFGFSLIPVPMLDDGPDMEMVERLAAEDPSVKGIWCVPVYSNPTGTIYSERTVRRLASMPCAAEDFTIMWDNAYALHSLNGEYVRLPNIMELCAEAGYPERAVMFASTSKITFAGGGVGCMACGPQTLKAALAALSVQTIGFDKVNQLLHARFLKSRENILLHMAKHAEIIRPKFETVLSILSAELGGWGLAVWSKPLGGYFINFVGPKNTAKRIVELCAQAGVKLTPAGAAFPYGIDPDDSNIRIAPTYPSLGELETATKLLALSTKIAALERALL
ncbi:MAG: aminotransferase class I/II-fold pyridoxal phosphate-dependent enzyme [Oscillospiraceae bacterium]|nr:aminotransferase class I/II-fold pyridoxal phosphate-dependent enzyme [Oscillospiraceae bacterium]